MLVMTFDINDDLSEIWSLFVALSLLIFSKSYASEFSLLPFGCWILDDEMVF